jgi:uncharacterized membrane protein
MTPSARKSGTTVGSGYGGTDANVGTLERVLSAAAGVALIGYSYRRNRFRSVLVPLGTSLVTRAVTGRSAVNRALGRNSARRTEPRSPVASVNRGQGIRIEQSVIIDRPPDELYAFWSHLENLPRFLGHLQSVERIGGRRSHWIAKGPARSRIEWDAEIHNEIEDELIAWRSLPGSEVPNAGSVHFLPIRGGASTEVRVVLSYEPPAGRLGAAVAKLFGEEPSGQVREDLARLKLMFEAGDPAVPGDASPRE